MASLEKCCAERRRKLAGTMRIFAEFVPGENPQHSVDLARIHTEQDTDAESLRYSIDFLRFITGTSLTNLLQ